MYGFGNFLHNIYGYGRGLGYGRGFGCNGDFEYSNIEKPESLDEIELVIKYYNRECGKSKFLENKKVLLTKPINNKYIAFQYKGWKVNVGLNNIIIEPKNEKPDILTLQDTLLILLDVVSAGGFFHLRQFYTSIPIIVKYPKAVFISKVKKMFDNLSVEGDTKNETQNSGDYSFPLQFK